MTSVPLPEIRPEELNKVLILLAEFGQETGVTKETLVSAMRSVTYGGEIGGAELALDLATALGFVQIAPKDVIRLTREGMRLVSLNPEKTYELAPSQARFLTHTCIASPDLNAVFRTLLARFKRDTTRGTFWLRLPAEMSRVERGLFDLLIRLGFITVRGADAEVTITYRDQASLLRSSRALSQEELEMMLALRKQQGDAAERWVMLMEQERLRRDGFDAEADAVDRISETDVSAGFDIASFDGNSPRLRHDRFIEVKSTAGSTPSFVWTINEYEKAGELGNSYWIYLVVGFNPQIPQNSTLLRIQNPAVKCSSGGGFTLAPCAFQVTILEPQKYMA